MDIGVFIIIATAIILFIKPIQMIVMYVERMVIINTSEDFVDFDRRANAVAEQVAELGPVRVEDLPDLFIKHNIPSVASARKTTKKVVSNKRKV